MSRLNLSRVKKSTQKLVQEAKEDNRDQVDSPDPEEGSHE